MKVVDSTRKGYAFQYEEALENLSLIYLKIGDRHPKMDSLLKQVSGHKSNEENILTANHSWFLETQFILGKGKIKNHNEKRRVSILFPWCILPGTEHAELDRPIRVYSNIEVTVEDIEKLLKEIIEKLTTILNK